MTNDGQPDMYCPECGERNPERANFCQSCGRRLKAPTTLDSGEEPPAPLLGLFSAINGLALMAGVSAVLVPIIWDSLIWFNEDALTMFISAEIVAIVAGCALLTPLRFYDRIWVQGMAIVGIIGCVGMSLVSGLLMFVIASLAHPPALVGFAYFLMTFLPALSGIVLAWKMTIAERYRGKAGKRG